MKAPAVTAEQMRELDRRARDEFGIPVKALMENAGRAVAEESVRFLKKTGSAKPWKVLLFCGGGNNGGDGLVAARLLAQQGIETRTFIFKPADSLKDEVLSNFEELGRLSLPYEFLPKFAKISQEIRGSSLLIDALLGTGLKSKVRGDFAQAIGAVNGSGLPVLSVDVPSGMDADSGAVPGTCVKAALTVTMGALKKGFLNPRARRWTGNVRVADIGFPKELLADLERKDGK